MLEPGSDPENSSQGSHEESEPDVTHDDMACPAVEEAEVQWDAWEDRVEEHRRTRPLTRAARAASTVDVCAVSSEQSSIAYDRISVLDKGDARCIAKHMNQYLTPCMPTIHPEKDEKKKHRDKMAGREIPFNLMVARPVGPQEMTDFPEAQAAIQKEWAALKEQKVWDLLIVREKSDVVAEARRLKKEVQFGRVHGICVEEFRASSRTYLQEVQRSSGLVGQPS